MIMFWTWIGFAPFTYAIVRWHDKREGCEWTNGDRTLNMLLAILLGPFGLLVSGAILLSGPLKDPLKDWWNSKARWW